ncbi:MAG: heparin lyase I family protein [Pirellulales bacterium]
MKAVVASLLSVAALFVPISGALSAEVEAFPPTGTYQTDKRGAITVWGLPVVPQSAEQPYSIGVRGDVLRLEVREGDRRRKPSEADRPIERCEVMFPEQSFAFGKTYAIRFAMMFEPGPASTAKNDKFFQVHNVNDKGDGILGPVFAMQLEDEHMRIVVRWDAERITKKRVEDHWVFEDTADIRRGQWYDFDVVVRFDPFGKGLLTVRRDGVELVNYDGPLGYNDELPPYPKVGIYRDTRPEPQARRYRALTITELK